MWVDVKEQTLNPKLERGIVVCLKDIAIIWDLYLEMGYYK
jgi:hypothetical protein